MGAIDQSDVKVHVMKLSKEGFPNWHMKQLAFLIENSIGNAHANFNLDPKKTQAEFFYRVIPQTYCRAIGTQPRLQNVFFFWICNKA